MNSNVLCVYAHDLDSGSEEGIQYSITAGNVNNTFALNASTGKVKIARPVDYENIRVYDLVVEASDTFVINESVAAVGSGSGNQSYASFSSYTNVTVFILDVNDNPPQFSKSQYSVLIDENLPPDSALLRVRASDRDTGESGAVFYSLIPNDGFGLFAINRSSGEITTNSSMRDANYLTYSLQLLATDRGLLPLSGTSVLRVRVWYDVTFHKNATDIFRFSFHGVFPFGEPAVHSRESVQLDLGLLNQIQGSIVTRVGRLQRTKSFLVAREPAATARAVVLSSWHDYEKVRIAVQVSDRYWNTRTSTKEVRFELQSLITKKKVVFSCAPSPISGTCIASASIPTLWLNSTSANHTVLINYGVSPSRMSSLSSILLTAGPRKLQFEDNFLVAAPLYLLHVGDTFSMQVYARFRETIASYVLLFSVSPGLNVMRVRGADGWTVHLASNGPTEFAVFGSRSDTNKDATTPYFTLAMEVTETVSFKKNEELTCLVKYVGSIDGNTFLPKQVNEEVSALISDRFGVFTVGSLVVVKDQTKALFVYADRSVLVNSAVLNGRQIDVALHVRRVSVLGRVTNASNPTCRSMATDVLKVSADCSKVFLDGKETAGSQNAVVLIKEDSVTANVSFIVWRPITPLSLSVSLRRLNKIKNWFDPSQSCRPRYQHSRVRAVTNLTNGKITKYNVDVTHLIRENLRSSDSDVAEVQKGVIEGRSKGEATIDVFNPEIRKVLGETAVMVTDEEVRVYVVDTLVATRLSIALPPLLNRSINHLMNVQAEERFFIPFEEASVVVSLQFSDGNVNTFDDLDGFYVNFTNNSVMTLQSSRVIPVSPGKGSNVSVTVHSGHCSNEYVGSGVGHIDVSFVEPIEIRASISSRYITPPGDPAKRLGVPVFALVKVVLFYNVSGEVERFDVSNDSRTFFNFTKGRELVDLLVEPQGALISPSANKTGKVKIVIGYLHAKRTASITVDVLGAKELKLLANPYPPFNNSDNYNITQLHPMGNSQERQQVRFKLLLVLTNGSAVDASQDNTAIVSLRSTQPPELAQKVRLQRNRGREYVLQVAGFSDRGEITLQGIFTSISSRSLSLRVETSPLTVTSVKLTLPSNFTLQGIQNTATLQLSVDVGFSDGSMFLELFSKENKTLWNLIAFTTQATERVSLNSTSGLVTLKSNTFREITVTASALGSLVTHSVNLACNLDPDVGDVDIGDVNGVPLKPRDIGETFTAMLRINTGSAVLGSFDIELSVEPAMLEIVQVQKGPDMAGLFLSNIMARSGRVRIAGVLNLEGGESPLLRFAMLKLRATSSGIARITGRILMMAEDDVRGTQIGSSFPRDIVAGDVEIEIREHESRSRRSVALPPPRDPRSVSVCPKPPCSLCLSGRERGDVDWNCIFDIRDIKFTLTYVTEKQFNFSRPKGKEIQQYMLPGQLQSLDADGDGVVSVSDVNRLLKANLKLVSMSPAVRVIPVQDPHSHCLLTISVPADDLGVHPSSADNSRVYFHISHHKADFSLHLQQTSVVQGEFVTMEKGEGLHGRILLARFNNISKKFEAALNTSLVLPDIGVSVIKIGFKEGGFLDFAQSFHFYGKFSKPPLYPAQLNLSFDLGSGRQYSVKRLQGYNPLILFNNTLASSNCSDDPLLEETLSDLRVYGARTIFVAWKIRNIRGTLNFTFNLVVKECGLVRVNEPCVISRVDVQGKSHSLTNLRPYSNYSVKIETKNLPLRSTNWKSVSTLEAGKKTTKRSLISALTH